MKIKKHKWTHEEKINKEICKFFVNLGNLLANNDNRGIMQNYDPDEVDRLYNYIISYNEFDLEETIFMKKFPKKSKAYEVWFSLSKNENPTTYKKLIEKVVTIYKD